MRKAIDAPYRKAGGSSATCADRVDVSTEDAPASTSFRHASADSGAVSFDAGGHPSAWHTAPVPRPVSAPSSAGVVGFGGDWRGRRAIAFHCSGRTVASHRRGS